MPGGRGGSTWEQVLSRPDDLRTNSSDGFSCPLPIALLSAANEITAFILKEILDVITQDFREV